jgi:hypothetical protein
LPAPLVELEYGTDREGGRRALRVLDDGRFELRSDVDVDVDAEGRASVRPVPPEWRLQWTYTPEQLAELEREVAGALDPPLHPRYPSPTRGIHSRELIWRLRGDGGVVETVVEGYPANRVAPLERLYHRLFELHEPEQETSLWRIRTPSGVVETLVDRDASEVADLRPVLEAIYRRDADAPEGPAPPPSDGGEPLVEIAWRSGGKPVDVTRVFADGRQEVVRDGEVERLEPLSPGQLRALGAALAAVDWESLPPVL